MSLVAGLEVRGPLQLTCGALATSLRVLGPSGGCYFLRLPLQAEHRNQLTPSEACRARKRICAGVVV
eukprot:4602346-Alexandrium_andersonii.AAC.1